MKPYIYILLIVGIASSSATPSLFRYPFQVTTSEDVALVVDLHNTDHYFHAFTYSEWKHIYFGKRGDTLKEMLSAKTFQFNSINSIWALDANKMQMTRWSISPANKTFIVFHGRSFKNRDWIMLPMK